MGKSNKPPPPPSTTPMERGYQPKKPLTDGYKPKPQGGHQPTTSESSPAKPPSNPPNEGSSVKKSD